MTIDCPCSYSVKVPDNGLNTSLGLAARKRAVRDYLDHLQNCAHVIPSIRGWALMMRQRSDFMIRTGMEKVTIEEVSLDQMEVSVA